MSWKIVKLGNVISQRKEFITIDDSVEYKRCRVQVNRKGVVLRDIVKGSLINTKKQQLCKEGDFLVAEIDAKVGGYGFVEKNLEDAIVSSHYFLFEVDESEMLKSYLAWLIKTEIIQEQINSKGSTNYAAIRPINVLNFEIPLPSIKEQKKLIKRLNNVDKKYSSLQNELIFQQTYLQQLRQSILLEAVQGKLTKRGLSDKPASKLIEAVRAEKQLLIKTGKLKKEKPNKPITAEEVPFELPEGWVWCSLKELLAFDKHAMKRGPFGSSLRKSMFVNKGIRVFEQYNPINDDPYWARYYITEEQYEELKSFTAVPGDLLISCSGTLGRITEIPNDTSFGIINQALLKLTINKDVMSNGYFKMLFRSSFLQDKILEEAGGSAITNMVGVDVLKALLIPLPPFSEQQRIVAKVEHLMQMVNQLEQQVQQSYIRAQQLLQTVLKEAFQPVITTS